MAKIGKAAMLSILNPIILPNVFIYFNLIIKAKTVLKQNNIIPT